MKPIEYFSLFEEAKNNFISAAKKKDFKAKMMAARDMMKTGHQIVHNNWHTAVKNLFVSESNKNENPEAREMYTTWVPLIDVITQGLEVVNTYYGGFYHHFTEAVDIVDSFSKDDGSIPELKELSDELIKTMVKDFEMPLKGVNCIAEGMYIPLSVIAGMVRDFTPDHFLVKEEKIVISQN